MNLSAKVESLKEAERRAALIVASLASDLLVNERMSLETRKRMKLALSELSGIRKGLLEAQRKLSGPF